MRRLVQAAIVLICGATSAHAAEPAPVSALPMISTPANFADDGLGGLLSRATPAADASLLDWRAGEARIAPKASLRIRVADPLAAGRGQPLRGPAFAGSQAYEVSVVRDWPGAVAFQTARFGVDLTPHAGLGVTSFGGLAEAGATLKLSQRVDSALKAGLGAMGVGDGARFGDKGRWYLFAAASGRAVGLNMLHGDTGWARAGWTLDQSSTLVGDAQLGVGWRKGPMQTSLGFVHREMKGLHTLYGVDAKADSLVAFSFSVRPRR